MTQVTAISEARQLVKQRSDDVETAYAQLVDDLAANIERSPEDVLEVLEAAGKDFETLEGDLSRVEARIAAKVQADQLPAAEKRLAEIVAEQESLNAELNEVQQRARVRSEALRGELNGLQSRIAGLEEHRRKLSIGTYDSPSQKLRQVKITAELRRVAGLMAAERDLIREWEKNVVGNERNIAHFKKGDAEGNLMESKSKLTIARERVAQHKAKLTTLEAEHAGVLDTQQQLINERVS